MHDVPWHVYVLLRDSLDASGKHLRLTYLEGSLELMSPSPEHEESKSIIGGLLEAWCIDHGVDIFPQGSTTYRSEPERRGLEPDESYSVHEHKSIPDLAIEVVYSSYRVDKLDVYRGLRIGEVWVLQDASIRVHRLVDGVYEDRATSDLFPEIDLDALARLAVPGTSLTSAVKAFRASYAAAQSNLE